MRQVFLLICLLLCFGAWSQNVQYLGAPNVTVQNRGHLRTDSSFQNAIRDTTFTPSRLGVQVIRPQDTTIYYSISTTTRPYWSRASSANGGTLIARHDSIFVYTKDTVFFLTTYIPARNDTFYVQNGVAPGARLVHPLNDSTVIVWRINAGNNITLDTSGQNVTINADVSISPLDTAGISNRINLKVDSVTYSASPFIDTLYYWINGAQTLIGYNDRTADGLISGGIVTHRTGLIFDVSPAVYRINGIRYSSPLTSITLATADATNPRLDVIAVNISGQAVAITGTPASTPATPQIDPSTQLYLTSILIPAGATTPANVTSALVYDENAGTPTEYNTSTSGTVTANYNSTAQSFNGTKSAAVSAWSNGSALLFTNSTTATITNYTSFSFWVRLTANLTNQQSLSVQFYNGSTAVSSTVTASITKNSLNTWQLAAFNISQFTFTSTTFDRVRISLSGNGISTFYVDYLRFQGGITQPGNGSEVDPRSVHILDSAAMLSHYFRDAIAVNDTTFGLVRGDGTTKNVAISVNSTFTGTANQVLATPDGTSGAATLRSLVAADIPTLTSTKISDFTAAATTAARSAVSLAFTTTGTSGVATGTYNSTTGAFTINVPNYAGGGGGGTDANAWHLTGDAATAGTNFLGTTNNVSLRFRTNNTERFRIDSTGRIYQNYGTKSINILADGVAANTGTTADRAIAIGDPGTAGGTVTTAIGHSTFVSGTGAVAIGYLASASNGGIAISAGGSITSAGGGGVAIGNSSTAAGTAATGIGVAATAAGTNATSVGRSSAASGSQTTAIGYNVTASGSSSLAIGDRSSSTHNFSVAIGVGGRSTATNQFVGGGYIAGSTAGAQEVYFGSGPQADGTTTIGGLSYSLNGSGGFGSNQTGGHLTIAGGKGTGTGTPGDVIFSTASAGSTGTTLQSLTPRLTIKGETGQLILSSVSSLPTYADETAATSAGLASGTFYKSSDGIVRIKL